MSRKFCPKQSARFTWLLGISFYQICLQIINPINSYADDPSSLNKQEKPLTKKGENISSDNKTKQDNSEINKSTKPEVSNKAELDTEKINKLLESSNVFGEQFRVSSFIQNNEVTVQTWTNPKSKEIEKDSKIDAVIIAKRLMDNFPNSIKVCKVRYFDRQDRNSYIEITVMPGIVKSFAAGIMSEEDLMGSLPLTKKINELAPPVQNPSTKGNPTISTEHHSPIDPNSVTTVIPGKWFAERQDMLRRLQILEKGGVRSPTTRSEIAHIEESIRDGNENDAYKSLLRLYSPMAEMEKNYRKAKASRPSSTVATGSLIKNNHISSSSTQHTTATSPEDEFKEGISIIKRKMGEFYPHYGPLYLDRLQIGEKLYEMKSQNKPTDQYKTPFLNMEAFASQNSSQLSSSIKNLNSTLGLKEVPRDEEYAYQQKVADSRKGQD